MRDPTALGLNGEQEEVGDSENLRDWGKVFHPQVSREGVSDESRADEDSSRGPDWGH